MGGRSGWCEEFVGDTTLCCGEKELREVVGRVGGRCRVEGWIEMPGGGVCVLLFQVVLECDQVACKVV